MSNRIYVARKQYVDDIDDNPALPEWKVVFDPTVYGLVVDDYDEMEVADFESPEDPLANVKKAYEIAEKIKAEIRDGTGIYSVRDWYDRHRDDPDFEEHCWMRED